MGAPSPGSALLFGPHSRSPRDNKAGGNEGPFISRGKQELEKRITITVLNSMFVVGVLCLLMGCAKQRPVNVQQITETMYNAGVEEGKKQGCQENVVDLITRADYLRDQGRHILDRYQKLCEEYGGRLVGDFCEEK